MDVLINTICPLDNRYYDQIKSISYFFSYYNWIKYRVKVELFYFQFLCQLPEMNIDISPEKLTIFMELINNININDILEIEKTTFHDGSSAFLKIYRFDELMEENTEKKFQKTGISVFSKKACHEKTFFEKSIENNDLKDRYFGELQCDRISELLEEFDTNNSLNKKHPPYNNVPIINTDRLHGLNKNHPFVKNHLYKWASGHLKELIEKDKKNNQDNKFANPIPNFNDLVVCFKHHEDSQKFYL